MLRFLTAGESHGPELTVIVEGFPAGVPVNLETLNGELARRQKSFGSGGRMNIEQDQAIVSSGLLKGQTTGAPLALRIKNKDWENWKDQKIPPMTTPRPGHADLTGSLKYQYNDLRLSLERASARETAARVVAGALCKQLLNVFEIFVGSYVTAIGSVKVTTPLNKNFKKSFDMAETNDLRCPDPKAYAPMKEAISLCMKNRDTLGGIIEVFALGLPPGLGSHVHYDRRLDGLLMGLLGSIPAIKGVEIGPAFDNCSKYGSEVHGEITLDDNKNLQRRLSRSGGLEGGISTGEPLVARLAMKPLCSVMKSLPSVDLATGSLALTDYERSDFCAVPRAGVVAEAMLAFGLVQALLEKLGGDHLSEIKQRWSQLPQNRLDDLKLASQPWKFDY